MSGGKVAYAALFCIVLPALLWLWARAAEPSVTLPAVQSTIGGALLAGVGVALMLAGMFGLRVHGGGLPMNAFPPPRRAERGIYAWLDHPIYAGFCVSVAGAAVWTGSRAGLWLVTPCTVLACAALVLGYERDDLERRLGRRGAPPRLRLAPDTDEPPDLWDRVSLVVLVFLPWLLLYEAVGHLPRDGALSTALAIDARVPIVAWTEVLYAATYALGVIPALLLCTRRDLRRFQIAGWAGTAVGFLVCIVLPNEFPLRPFPPGSVFAPLHALESVDGVGGRVAFPSFHVFWAVMGAWAIAKRGAGAVGALLALGVAISCVTTGEHGIVDVLAGAALAAAALNADRARRLVLAGAQAVADGWREWQIGPVRVLMHAWYAGLSAGVGMLLAEALAGEDTRPTLRVMAGAALVGAGAWGQAFEGSGTLARPFGYYGCVLGALLGALGCAAAGWEVWGAVGALAVATPWIQAIGRLRCLVQGCCHGAPCADGRGLRYTTARSRVCALAELRGVPVHATQVLSIVANIAVGLLLVRLHFAGAAIPLIVGLYLLLSGLARFVEEHFRGEPQTAVIGGLRSYQWAALASVVAGAAAMCVRGPSTLAAFELPASVTVSAAVCAAVFGLAMGVDFPASSRRLARLA